MAVTPGSIITPQVIRSYTAITTSALPVSAGPQAWMTGPSTNGGRLTRLHAIPRATIAATALYLYNSKDSGTTWKFLMSMLMAATSVGPALLVPKTDFGFSDANPLILAPNELLGVGMGVALAAGVSWRAEWGEF